MFRTHQILRSARQVRKTTPIEAPPPPKDAPPPLTMDGLVDAAAIDTDPGTVPDQVAISPASAATYQMLVQAAQSIFDHSVKKEAPDSGLIMRALKEVLQLFQQDDSLLTESVRRRNLQASLAGRTANTALLSMRIGLEIGYNERRCTALGLCALMHDLGMQTIPEKVLNSPKLTPEEFQLLRQHPVESRKIVESFGGEFAWIGAVVVQVHERHDGGGYPAGIKGEAIHEFARIIGLADVYEAMAHPRADREAVVIYHALSEIIDVRNKFFDPDLIKALIHIVSIFPLGSLVKLNNGAIGRVIGANKLYPTRPLLEVLLTPQGTPVRATTFLNLEDEPMLTIADPAIDESVLDKSKNKAAAGGGPSKRSGSR